MGIFSFMKKKEDTPKLEPLKLPGEPKPSSDQKTDIVEDENASFEIPDFSDEDLDFNVDVQDFVPPTQEKTSEEPEQQKKQVEPTKTPAQKPEELPKFETSTTIDSSSLSKYAEFEKTASKPTKPTKPTPAPKKEKSPEVFVEKEDYLKLLIREDTIVSEINKNKDVSEKLKSHSKELETEIVDLKKNAKEIKDILLKLDSDMFEKGE